MNDSDLTVTRPDGDTAAGATSSVLAANLLTIECWEVEHGDILWGLHHRIESILTDGKWWYYGDEHGTIIARRAVGSRVQVVRGGSDDCSPHGIARPARHLEVVR
jgi:hypothetical protein